MELITTYINNIKSLLGLTQIGVILLISGYGIKWSGHKVLNSVISTQQLQAYNEYSSWNKIWIGIMNASTESVVFLFSLCVLFKGMYQFIDTPLSLYPLVFGKFNVE